MGQYGHQLRSGCVGLRRDGVAGTLGHRYGLGRVNGGTWFVWAVAVGALALPVESTALALTSAAAFGATYMALTGICILRAARLFPEAPARGVTLSFLGLGVGQTLGSPLAGALADVTGSAVVFAGTAVVSLFAARYQHPRRIPEPRGQAVVRAYR